MSGQYTCNNWRCKDDGTVEIELTQGKIALVDLEDVGRVLAHKWYTLASGKTQWYARTDYRLSPRKLHRLLMHQIILGPAPIDQQIDHKNRNGLDNRRCNLRFATRSENLGNAAKPLRNSTSQFKGVHLFKPNGKWRASIRKDRKLFPLGYFTTEIEAAQAYNKAAQKYFGEFARLNLI